LYFTNWGIFFLLSWLLLILISLSGTRILDGQPSSPPLQYFTSVTSDTLDGSEGLDTAPVANTTNPIDGFDTAPVANTTIPVG
jgi:hypothetical protein